MLTVTQKNPHYNISANTLRGQLKEFQFCTGQVSEDAFFFLSKRHKKFIPTDGKNAQQITRIPNHLILRLCLCLDEKN